MHWLVFRLFVCLSFCYTEKALIDCTIFWKIIVLLVTRCIHSHVALFCWDKLNERSSLWPYNRSWVISGHGSTSQNVRGVHLLLPEVWRACFVIPTDPYIVPKMVNNSSFMVSYYFLSLGWHAFMLWHTSEILISWLPSNSTEL